MAAKKNPAKKAVAKTSSKKVASKKAKSVKAVTSDAAPKPKAKKTSKKAAVKKTAAKTVVKKAAEPAKRVPVKLTAFVSKQRQRLLDLRDRMADAMSGVAGEIRDSAQGNESAGGGMHQGDAGSDAYDRDFALSVLAKEQDALYEIGQALRRIDAGVYGICEISGAKIPATRLEAIPFARLTVECQSQWEKEHGLNVRFRPSAERGFSSGHVLDRDDSAAVSLDGNGG